MSVPEGICVDLETSFAQEVNPAQNDVMQLNKDLAHEIGSYDGTNYYYNGYNNLIVYKVFILNQIRYHYLKVMIYFMLA